MIRPLALAAAALVANTGAVRAAELTMFETNGCPFCIRWHKEIGPIYPKTSEGKLAPLRIARLGQPPVGLTLTAPVRYAPTFILSACGQELGRIVGYNGEDFFWGEVSVLLKSPKAKAKSAC